MMSQFPDRLRRLRGRYSLSQVDKPRGIAVSSDVAASLRLEAEVYCRYEARPGDEFTDKRIMTVDGMGIFECEWLSPGTMAVMSPKPEEIEAFKKHFSNENTND